MNSRRPVASSDASPDPVAAPPADAAPTPAPSDGRESRELTSQENADLCAGCVTCCTYVTIEIDAPRQAWEYDQWIWMLHHEGIEMYVERPEKWFVYVATRCKQLNHDGRCKIHGRHPVLCRDYDPRTCERRYPLSDVRAWFKDAESLEVWIETTRPVHWRRLVEYRTRTPDGPPKAKGNGLVQIAAGIANGSRAR